MGSAHIESRGSVRANRLVVAPTLALMGFLLAPAAGLAQTVANVAVVINEKSPASVQIGEHYVRARGIPAENVIRLTTEPANTITLPRYAAEIEAPISRALTRERLQDRILFIVLTKGIPLRITGTPGPRGTSASVDSELTLLYRRMTGRAVPPQGTTANPYFLGEDPSAQPRPFDRKAFDIFLVTRLDGFSVDDVLKLIDRGQPPNPAGTIVLDQLANARSTIPDRWMAEAAVAIRSTSVGRLVDLEGSEAAATTTGPTLGYFSWGSTDPALKGRPLKLPFVPGSIAATLGSTEVSTFDPAPTAVRPMAGDLIAAGASGVGGYVAEPYLQSSIRPQILFPAYLQGLTLAEAFYSALPHLSWQSVVIGDPLTQPFGKAPATEIESPVDSETGVPTHFLERSMEVLRTELPAVPAEALKHVIASEMHQARDDRAAAIAALTKATELAPKFATAHLRLSMLHEEAGEAAKATEGYRKVLELDPRNGVALNNLAYTLAKDEAQLDVAYELAKKAYAVAPNDGTVIDTLGWIEHLRGNNIEATRLLRQAAQRAPNSADVRLHAAIALADAGAANEARTHLDAALKLDASIESRDEVKRLREQLRK